MFRDHSGEFLLLGGGAVVDSNVRQNNEVDIAVRRDVGGLNTLSKTDAMTDTSCTATYTTGLSQIDSEGSIGRKADEVRIMGRQRAEMTDVGVFTKHGPTNSMTGVVVSIHLHSNVYGLGRGGGWLVVLYQVARRATVRRRLGYKQVVYVDGGRQLG